MLRFVCSAIAAIALVVLPASITTKNTDQARAEATTKSDTGTEKADKKAAKKEKKEKKKRERTEKQKAAAERQKRCGAEYQEAKKAGKLAKGMTWRKYNAECLARLKAGK